MIIHVATIMLLIVAAIGIVVCLLAAIQLFFDTKESYEEYARYKKRKGSYNRTKKIK